MHIDVTDRFDGGQYQSGFDTKFSKMHPENGAINPHVATGNRALSSILEIFFKPNSRICLADVGISKRAHARI